MGIISFGVGYPNVREYVQTELTDGLTQGIRYHVGFQASAADFVQYAISTLGATLTAEPPPVVSTWHPDGMLDADPQVLQHGRLPLMDTARWVLISDTVLAQGGERYLTIGNFHLDGESDTVRFNPDQPPINGTPTTYAYYYIDDVFVYAIDSVPNGIGETEELNFSVYLNPAIDVLHIRGNGHSAVARLLDMAGREVLRNSGKLPLLMGIGHLPKGLYFIELNSNGRKSVKKVVVQ